MPFKRMRTALLSLSFFLFLAALPFGGALAQELVKVPPLAGHVNDHAAMLDADQRARLEQTLTDYETASGSQISRPAIRYPRRVIFIFGDTDINRNRSRCRSYGRRNWRRRPRRWRRSRP